MDHPPESHSESEDETYTGRREYVVTPYGLTCITCGMGSQTLLLEAEEAVLTTTTCCDEQTKRLPYGELGNVEHNMVCGCCHNFTTNLSQVTEDGPVPVSPGCGCQQELVEEIVNQLKARMRGRGDTGNIRRAEDAVALLTEIWKDITNSAPSVEAALSKFQVARPPAVSISHAPEQFVMLDDKFHEEEYDVTDRWRKICCCRSAEIVLEPEEVFFKQSECCGLQYSETRLPYGQLEHVSETLYCDRCICVGSSLGSLTRGCCCDRETMEELAEHMRVRQKARGNTGNILRQEETIRVIRLLQQRLLEQDAKVRAVVRSQGKPVPPPQQGMP